MNEMKPISNSRNNIYKVAIILLVAYAAYSTAMRDLYRLQEVAIDVHEFTTEGLGGLAKVYSSTRSLADGPQLARAAEMPEVNKDPRIDIIAAGGSVELKGLDREPLAQTTVARSAKFGRHGNTLTNSDAKVFKYLAHNFVSAGKQTACDSLKLEQLENADDDEQVNVLAQLPTRLALLRPRVQIESDIETVGAARDRARFRSVIKKIPASSRNVRWPGVSEFKSVNEVISLGLAAAKSAEANTDHQINVSESVPFYFVEKAMTGVAGEDTDREMHR